MTDVSNATASPTESVRDALTRIRGCTHPGVWITVIDEAEALRRAERVEARLASGEDLPLAGLTMAVKDNIDAAGFPTTAGHPAWRRDAAGSATAVQRCEDAGAIDVGKTNLDQFATGLVGTRSPYGVCPNPVDPAYVGGGSSSGSAAAVALGLVDFAFSTDTAGSGRVPAALTGIVGVKATYDSINMDGVVPASASFDCLGVLARSVALADRVRLVMTDPHAPAGAPVLDRLRGASIAVPPADFLRDVVDAPTHTDFRAAVQRVHERGASVVEVDLGVLFEAGRLLYGGAFVSERYDAFGEFLEQHEDGADPTVFAIVTAARDTPAHALARDWARLRALRRAAAPIWARYDAVLLPTVATTFTLQEVAADPVGTNARLGELVTFCNLLDCAAVSVPSGARPNGLPLGVTFYGPASSDAQQARFAADFTGEPAPEAVDPAATIDLVVVGAHLEGQPLNWQLTELGARKLVATETAPSYRMVRLATEPPKPGLIRTAIPGDGAALAVEVWSMSATALGRFMTRVAAPLAIGRVELADGTWKLGFVCEGYAAEGAPDITAAGGWVNHLRAGDQGRA
ncbi:MAG: allophanate hydrolase [Actinomycetia bacterium]|nr:allophanate hydrolase [Actinomycetes bacterium]